MKPKVGQIWTDKQGRSREVVKVSGANEWNEPDETTESPTYYVWWK